MRQIDVAAAAIAAYRPSDNEQQQLRSRFAALCSARPDALDRTCMPSHLTASAVVVSHDGDAVLLHHHRKLDQWLQLGGHCDGDGDLARVALREAREESGIDGLAMDPAIVDLDVHEVAPPGEMPHEHWDVRFVVSAPPAAEPTASDESRAIGWFAWDRIDDVVTDPRLLALLRRLRPRFDT